MKFGTGQRSQLGGHSTSPGPGNYAYSKERLQKSAPKFGFGTGAREGRDNKKMNVPGPGNYAS